MRNPKITFACGVVMTAIAASGVVTNVWKGSENGGMWNVPENWTKTLTPTEATVYDFSKLENGAEVINNYVRVKDSAEQLQVAGLIFGRDKGTVTLIGTSTSETIFAKSSFFEVPSGTVFDCRLRHTTGPWKDANATLRLCSDDANGGEVRFLGSNFVPTMWILELASTNSVVSFDNVGESFMLARLLFKASRIKVVTTGDIVFADVLDSVWPNKWPADANMIIGDGVSTLSLCSGFAYGVNLDNGNNIKQNFGMITNFASVVYSGGGGIVARGPVHANRYVFRNFDVDFGREYNLPANPLHNVSGAIQMIPGSAVDIDGSARVRTYCNQVLSTLSGAGTHGSFDIGGNINNSALVNGSLTVGSGLTSPTATVFNARLTGMGGGFVKKGTAYDLTLTGANTYTGATQVAEGRLTLKRLVSYGDSMFWWSFDGDPKADMSGCSSRNLVFYGDSSNFAVVQDGVRNTRALHIDGKKHAEIRGDYETAIIAGDAPHTIQFWIRPEKSGCCVRPDWPVSYIADFGTQWQGDFTRSRIVLVHADPQNDEYALLYTPTNNTPRVLAPGWGVNVRLKGTELFDGNWHQITYVYGREERLCEAYFDGVLKGSDVFSSPMALPKNGRLVIGYKESNSDHYPYYTGDVDDVKIIPRALTSEEVLRSSVFADFSDDQATPEPIIHWMFADSANIGADSCGVASLAAVEGMAVPSLCDARYAVDGKALNKEQPMVATYPECMPTGTQSFTVSCRYMPTASVGNDPILWWGDPSVENGYFRIQTAQSNLRSPAVGYSANKESCSWHSFSYANIRLGHTTAATAQGDCPSGWMDFTVSYDGISGILKMYVDGMLIAKKKDVYLNIKKGEGAQIHLGHQTINSTTLKFRGLIDDIQIFDRALTDDEVRLVVRKLHNETPVRIIENSPVTVSQGATLAFDGPGHDLENLSVESGTLHLEFGADFTPTAGVFSIGALTGAGILNLAEDRICQVTDASGFYGTVRMSSGARFEMDSEGRSMSADVYAENGACFKAASIAPIRTSGHVVLPSEATVVLDSVDCSDFPLNIFEASRITKGDVVWNFVSQDGMPLLADYFKVVESDSGLSVKMRKGTTVIIR